MSLDTLDTIDALGDGKDGTYVSLSIIDGWDWSDEAKHLLALQAKLNGYFDFVQSGQIFEARPSARGKALQIQILTKYALPEKAIKFLEIASKASQQLGIAITHRVLNKACDGESDVRFWAPSGPKGTP